MRMLTALLLTSAKAIGSSSLGIIIPALIFVVSFLATWLLYRHFSKQ
jgi:hypothetical protein